MNKDNEDTEYIEKLEHSGLKITKVDKLEFKGFDDMEFLSYNVLRGIFDYGFKEPSRIQNIAIKKIFEGIDIVAQSQAGTGKTGAFCIGTLSRINEELKAPQAIIIANTRELAGQIHSVIKNLAKHTSIQIELCVGGEKYEQSYNSNNHKHQNKTICTSQIIVGTPGKLRDLIKRGILKTKTLKILILDEADILLANDFVDQIREIFIQLPLDAQICIFSATFKRPIIDLSIEIMKDPELILIPKETLSLDSIKQYKIFLGQEKYKYETLKDLYSNICIGQCIIFVNKKEKADELEDQLVNDSFTVGKIHGGMTSQERKDVISNFRIGRLRVLISTNVLSRGIDIQQIGIVINYDIPREYSEYIHRIGRSGRFGKIGVAINFVTFRDKHTIEDIEEHFKISIVDMPEFSVINEQLSGLTGHLKI